MMNWNKTEDAIAYSCSYDLIFYYKYYLKDYGDDFLPEKWTLKIENGQFLTTFNWVVMQGIKKILWFGCKSLTNFYWHTMKFHDCHHANLKSQKIIMVSLPSMCYLNWSTLIEDEITYSRQ